jgi:VanZ family protein
MPATTPEHRAIARWLRLSCRWLSRLLDRRIAWPLCGVAVIVLIYGSLAPALAPPGAFQLDKLIHLVAYGGLAAVACLPCDRAKLGLTIAVMLIALGGMIEVAQSFVPGRFPSMGDFVANMIGVMLGVALSRLLRPSLAPLRDLRPAG